MPNRTIRDWTDSRRVNDLSPLAERFFTRLIMKADDYGKYYAHPAILRANLFPTQLDKVTEGEVAKWLVECASPGPVKDEPQPLVILYQSKGIPYLEIQSFGQRLRQMRHKFPGRQVDGQPVSDLTDNSHVSFLESESESESETEEEEGQNTPPKQPAAGKKKGKRTQPFEASRHFDRAAFFADCPKEWSDGEKEYWYGQAGASSNRGNKYANWVLAVQNWRRSNPNQYPDWLKRQPVKKKEVVPDCNRMKEEDGRRWQCQLKYGHDGPHQWTELMGPGAAREILNLGKMVGRGGDPSSMGDLLKANMGECLEKNKAAKEGE